MQFFMAHSSAKRWLCAVSFMFLAHSAVAHEALPTKAEAFDLMMQLSDVDITSNSSCQSAGRENSRTAQDIISHYLTVLAESENVSIKAHSHHVTDAARININFAVIDDEAPWKYGLQFRAAKSEKGWEADRKSLICPGQ
ncbi:hypothetical protein [Neptunomonas sp.]|uniref:hypothetical protein n=1 Tax=Neptunomonas sp. TaxID=1971898 RepID=UPI0025F664E2|nr:hypothetical protein [Neptunomonas sp.]